MLAREARIFEEYKMLKPIIKKLFEIEKTTSKIPKEVNHFFNVLENVNTKSIENEVVLPNIKLKKGKK